MAIRGNLNYFLYTDKINNEPQLPHKWLKETSLHQFSYKTIDTVILKINFGYMHFVLKTGRGVALPSNSNPPHYQTIMTIIILTSFIPFHLRCLKLNKLKEELRLPNKTKVKCSAQT